MIPAPRATFMHHHTPFMHIPVHESILLLNEIVQGRSRIYEALEGITLAVDELLCIRCIEIRGAV